MTADTLHRKLKAHLGPTGRFAGTVQYETFDRCFYYGQSACTVAGASTCSDGADTTSDNFLSDFNQPTVLFPASPATANEPRWDMDHVWVAQTDSPPTLAPTLFDFAAWGDCRTHQSGAVAGGAGTPESPLLIYTPAQLATIAITPGYGRGR